MTDEKNNFDSGGRGSGLRARHDGRTASDRILLFRRSFWLAAGLAGAASFALLYAPLPARADDFGIIFDDSSTLGTYDVGESNFTQQHYASIRNVTFSGAPYLCSVKIAGLTYAGTPTDELRVTLYSKSSSWGAGDLSSGGTLITSTTLTAAQIIGGTQTFSFSNCQGTTAGYSYGFDVRRTGGESDTDFYKIGYNNGSPTDLAIFSAGSWGDATPATKRGSIIVYGFDGVSGYAVLLDAPADGSAVNPPSGFLIRAVAPTSTTARVIYNDAYGGSWTVTSTVYSPQVYQEFNIPAFPGTFHNGVWTAQAYLLSSSSGVIALSGWNTFAVVPINYAQAAASATQAIAGGIFTIQDCASSTVASSSTLDQIGCVIRNGIYSFLNILARNLRDAYVQIAELGIFPLNVFKHFSDDLLAPPATTTSTAVTWRFLDHDYILLSSSTVNTAATRIGLTNFRQTLNYFMYLITGLIMIIIAIGVVADLKNKK